MEAKMKTVKKKEVSENPQKLTYEQLNDACNQLWQQNQQLVKRCHELETFNAFKRLDYLFKVLEFSSVIKDADYVNECIEEIKQAMRIPEVSEETAE